MVNTKAASIVAIFACTHAFAVELTRPLVARAHSVNYVSRGTIPALLRSAHQAKAATIARRASCSLGSFACEDGTGCCPFGQYCGEWDGLLGCCLIGRICGNSNDDECNHANYNVCAGDNFCCPSGGLCGRDSENRPECFDKDGSPASVVFTTTSHTSTKTSTTPRTTTTPLFTPSITGLPAITTVTSSPTVYTFPSTTITGPLQNGGDAPTTSTSLPTTLPASGGGSSGIIPNGATAIVSSASTVALLASFVVTLVAHY